MASLETFAARALYLVPVPIPVCLGVRELSKWSKLLVRRAGTSIKRPEQPPPNQRTATRGVVSALVAVLVILGTSIGLSVKTEAYLQPYITQQQYLDLRELGEALRPYASMSPILVVGGYSGTLYYSIERSYVGAFSGPVLQYFGRPQFLLSMTDPLRAEPWLADDPYPSRYVATRLYQELTGFVDEATLASHPIAVSAPACYDRPVSDYFIVKRRVADGLYIVPPNDVTALERNTWVWFAAYDWKTVSAFTAVAQPWAMSPRVLEYVSPSLQVFWEVEYYFALSETTLNNTLSLRLMDTPPFPAQWNVTPAETGSLAIYIDGVLLARHGFAYQGIEWVNFTLGSLSQGYHTVALRADDLNRPFGLGLDALAVYPDGMTLGNLLLAYAK